MQTWLLKVKLHFPKSDGTVRLTDAIGSQVLEDKISAVQQFNPARNAASVFAVWGFSQPPESPCEEREVHSRLPATAALQLPGLAAFCRER